MRSVKIICSLAAVALGVAALTACSAEPDITGYYTANQINNVYYFSDDGKIYENYATDSTSCYEINGDVIKLYNEEAENIIMEFDFKETENGFFIGELEYTKIDDPFENMPSEEDDSTALTGNEESFAAKEIPDITGEYEDPDGNKVKFANDGMIYENGAETSDRSWLIDGDIMVIRTLSENSSEINSLEITENGIKIGDTEYTKISE